MTIDDAIRLDSFPIILGQYPNSKKDIELMLGRFGPYLKMGEERFKLEKDASFLKLDIKSAIKIIDSALETTTSQ